MTEPSSPTSLTRVRRLPDRGRYDRGTIDAILDAGFVCHVGFAIDGQPFVTPTSYWREGDYVYFHGSAASRMLRAVGTRGVRCCLTVTHADGLVLARAAFHHSINYRSVMLFGHAEPVKDDAAKRHALKSFVEHLFPGRWATLRPMTDAEVKGTSVLRLPIDEASAKVRTGGPKDDEADYALPIWAGVIPLAMVAEAPEPDPRLPPGVETPAHAREFRRAARRPAS